MQRRLQDDISGFDDVQHVPFHLRVVHADQFLVECNGQGRLPTELRHIGPLPRLDGLFDAVDGVLRQEFQLIQRLLVLKGSVGIESQFHLMMREPFTDALHQIQFLVEVDGADLQFHATEALLQFLLHTLQHLLIAAHPHQSVDGNPHLAATERRIKQPIAIRHIQPRRFQSKKHRRILPPRIII